MNKNMRYIVFVLFFMFTVLSWSQEIAVMQYDGCGDWYVNPTSLPNLITFCNDNIQTKINPEPEVVKPSSPNLYRYPFIHLTGHGNVVFNDYERNNLRDRKSTRLNSSHVSISYAVFCLKKKKKRQRRKPNTSITHNEQ